MISLDCWMIIVSFSEVKDRNSVLCLDSSINEKCKNVPIYDCVLIKVKKIPEKEKISLLRNVKLISGKTVSSSWTDKNMKLDLARVEILDCSDNLISKIPLLPNLKKLICGCNLIIKIPSLPKLEYLDCCGNDLETLPELPNLVYLNCSFNNVRSIPNFPKLKTKII